MFIKFVLIILNYIYDHSVKKNLEKEKKSV